MPSRLEYDSKHKEWFFVGPIHWNTEHRGVAALAASCLFSPYLSDGLGRRPAIVIGSSIMIVAIILQAASHSAGMSIGARSR